MRIRVHGGHVVDPANGVDEVCDVYIADGRIVAVGLGPEGFAAEREIDAGGCVVCPGLVDVRAHLREPGQAHKASIASETAAAASGGITTLCVTPDTDPVIDTPAVVELIHHRARTLGKARVVVQGALTQQLEGKQISEMRALKEAGCVAISNALVPVSNTEVMRRAMEYAATHELTIFLHAEDPWLRDGCAHEGIVSNRLGLPGIPEMAETIAVARDLALVEQTGVRAHFSHLSSARAVQKISRAQYDGLAVSADVAAHQLFLTEMDIADFNAQCHVRPPLRTQRDRDGLRDGVRRNVVSAICSDHQPHDLDAKLGPFSTTEPGISALETFLPLSLRLVDEGLVTLSELIGRITVQPAGILGIEAGTLGVGTPADVCIFDPEAMWTLRAETMVSNGTNSPFTGWDLKGRVTHTLLEGKVVFELAEERV